MDCGTNPGVPVTHAEVFSYQRTRRTQIEKAYDVPIYQLANSGLNLDLSPDVHHVRLTRSCNFYLPNLHSKQTAKDSGEPGKLGRMPQTRDSRTARAFDRNLGAGGQTPTPPLDPRGTPPPSKKRPPIYKCPQIPTPPPLAHFQKIFPRRHKGGTKRRHPQARPVPLLSTGRAAKCAATARQGRGTGRKNRDRKKPHHRPEEPRSHSVRGYPRHPPPKPHHGPLMPFKRLVPSGAPPLRGVSGSLWVLRVCQPPL